MCDCKHMMVKSKLIASESKRLDGNFLNQMQQRKLMFYSLLELNVQMKYVKNDVGVKGR